MHHLRRRWGMATIDFPLSISEMTKMREDGDIVSLSFSYGCIGCFVLVFVLWSIYYLSAWTLFKTLSLVSLPLSAICLFLVYIYRPLFLSDEKRKQKGLERVRRKKYKTIDKLEGVDFEEAVGNLTPEERDGYLEYSDREISTKMLLDWVRRDRKLK
jgi:hypothetical protein